MALRDCLKYWRPEQLSLQVPQYPQKLSALCREIAQSTQAAKVQIPDPQSLRTLYELLSSCINRRESLAAIPHQMLSLAPWVFYYGEQHLADSIGFVDQYCSWLSTLSPSRQSRILVSLWYVMMQAYPVDSPSFPEVCTRLKAMLATSPKRKVTTIHAVCQKYMLLELSGPDVFAHDLLASSLHEASTTRMFPAELLSGQFVRQGCERTLSVLSGLMATPDNLEQLQAFLRSYEQEARQGSFFPRETTINALLLPFVDANASEHVYRQYIQDFLLRHFKDPRLEKRHWHGVNPEALRVMERWLVAAQLQDFFAILRDTAEPAWQERQAFWSRYLSKGVISKAWVVLGREARYAATKTTLSKNSFAELTGALAKQSVLLMQIDTLIIIEWSHSGACRFCDEDDANAPTFYANTYPGVELRPPDSNPIRHAGYWQGAIAQHIYERTGIR